MINLIIILIVVSDDCIVVRIVVGWFVVVSLGFSGCWSGDKTCFRGIEVMIEYLILFVCIFIIRSLFICSNNSMFAHLEKDLIFTL